MSHKVTIDSPSYTLKMMEIYLSLIVFAVKRKEIRTHIQFSFNFFSVKMEGKLIIAFIIWLSLSLVYSRSDQFVLKQYQHISQDMNHKVAVMAPASLLKHLVSDPEMQVWRASE